MMNAPLGILPLTLALKFHNFSWFKVTINNPSEIRCGWHILRSSGSDNYYGIFVLRSKYARDDDDGVGGRETGNVHFVLGVLMVQSKRILTVLN